jgi:pseudaminic acid synthase
MQGGKMKIGNTLVGTDQPAYFIAEISANHNQSYERAVEIVHAAHAAGANAIKIQTYSADTITIDSDKDDFLVKGTLWDGMNLYKLYQSAYTPWEWQADLKQTAESLGMDFFSSPFDVTAVDFLKSLDVCAYKVASSELVDIPLLRHIAKTGKPVIVSTGMATLEEVEEAVETLSGHGAGDILLLKCTASYPARYEEMHLRTIQDLSQRFSVPVGLSDHTMGHEVAVAAVALGACAVEKHLTLKRSDGGPDSGFSMEPEEFAAMVNAVRHTESALGGVSYGPSESEKISVLYRRSLYVVTDIVAGEIITPDNVKSIRPGYGMHTRHYDEVMGRLVSRDVEKGTPLSWELFD